MKKTIVFLGRAVLSFSILLQLFNLAEGDINDCPVEGRSCPTGGQERCTYQVPTSTDPVSRIFALNPNENQSESTKPHGHQDYREVKADGEWRGRNIGSPFKIAVNNPPSQQHLKAVQYCVSLAAATWVSDVETRAKFYFSSTLGRADILGDARSVTTWYVDGYLYPVAMAKSLLGEDVNALHYGDERYDIVVRLNSKTNWYLGTDSKPGENQYDLATVCLHELYHGLMISGANLKIDKNEADGGYDGKFYSNIDRRFDAFLACETNAGDCAIASYRGVDRMLGRSVTGNGLWFRSTNTRIARLYAPPVFRFGSSVYHLSESEYGNAANQNSLMTPSMPVGYAQHSIGPLILQMQRLMLNESEFGAPLCNSSVIPISKKLPIVPRAENTSDPIGTPESGGGCPLKIGSSCLGAGAIAGIAVGSIVGLFSLVGIIYFVACMGKPA